MNNLETQTTTEKPKSQMLYILLGITFGFLGIHNLYVGRRGEGITQLILFLLFFWTIIIPVGLMVWSVVEVCTVKTDGKGILMR
jgi:TM2 domain-containing membrane protein YozV